MCLCFVGLPVDTEQGFLVQPQLPLRCSQQRRGGSLKGSKLHQHLSYEGHVKHERSPNNVIYTSPLGEKNVVHVVFSHDDVMLYISFILIHPHNNDWQQLINIQTDFYAAFLLKLHSTWKYIQYNKLSLHLLRNVTTEELWLGYFLFYFIKVNNHHIRPQQVFPPVQSKSARITQYSWGNIPNI